MIRTLTRVVCASALASAAAAVLFAGPLTAAPIVSLVPTVTFDLATLLLALAG